MTTRSETHDDVAAVPVPASPARSRWRSFRLTMKGRWPLVISLAWLVGIVLAGLLVSFPHDPLWPNPAAISRPPSSEYWFGTDPNGFDVFSRVFVAAPRDIALSLGGASVALVIGTVLGLLAGGRGWGATLIVRALDVFQSFPLLILAIAVIALLGNRPWTVIAAIAIIDTPRFVRLIRSEVLVLRESRFIEAATALGNPPSRVLFRHVLPNVREVILAQFSLSAANAMMIITTMAFLGVGVNPPHPSWGQMAQEGAKVIQIGQWWAAAFPCIAIALCVWALNSISESLEFKGR
ncbi:peptide/nickel transport system permease protein [Salana multivorans]|uniref:Peptide/nickel transport system permease protein n=1 Tax=Salana multivorans TaxID=120377 RepID=A0A3N2DD83_9MICO|nr:ABC transporter permease [Salana multivorans]ROR97749.1 peptide/nickel transport system permease protein [Salana multivorans]